jgi:hypothetical protein
MSLSRKENFRYVPAMTATDMIKELKTLSMAEREKVFRWLQDEGLQELWRRADELMKDAPRVSEEAILSLPRARPS